MSRIPPHRVASDGPRPGTHDGRRAPGQGSGPRGRAQHAGHHAPHGQGLARRGAGLPRQTTQNVRRPKTRRDYGSGGI